MRPWQRMLAAREAFELHVTHVDGCRMLGRRSTVPARHDTPTIVLIGGTALSGRYLLPVAVELAGRFPVWVPDLPGRGASEAPKPALTVQEHADHLAAWMDRVGLDRAALLGNSMGCQIAVEAAVRHRKRLSHLILQGPTTDARARSLPRQFLRLALAGTREPMSLGPIEVVDWYRAGLRYAAASVRSTMRHRIEDRLPLVVCPTLVVCGAHDPVAPPEWGRRVQQLLPDGQLRVVPGSGHAMVYAQPLELARLTEAFLVQRR